MNPCGKLKGKSIATTVPAEQCGTMPCARVCQVYSCDSARVCAAQSATTTASSRRCSPGAGSPLNATLTTRCTCTRGIVDP
jgi:hypothetical protein